jgi:hypothetical protein
MLDALKQHPFLRKGQAKNGLKMGRDKNGQSTVFMSNNLPNYNQR